MGDQRMNVRRLGQLGVMGELSELPVGLRLLSVLRQTDVHKYLILRRPA